MISTKSDSIERQGTLTSSTANWDRISNGNFKVGKKICEIWRKIGKFQF